MAGALRAAAPKSVSLVVIASLKDLAALLDAHAALFVEKTREVVIMGGVESFEPGEAPAGALLVPDTAHNNAFDRDASEAVYRRCQQLGVRLRVLTRFAAYACQLPRDIYDRMAAGGSPIGRHLQWAQRQSIEKLWQRACAPEGSVTRAGLPARCDRAWFLETFCGAAGAAGAPASDAPIWERVAGFNAYDPLALLLVVPSLSWMFAPDAYVVDGVAHEVIGRSREATGIADASRLREWLCAALIEGIDRASPAAREAQRAQRVAELEAEVKRLRERLGE
jgi:hypothetical protein